MLRSNTCSDYWGAATLAAAAFLVLAGCSGPLSERSVVPVEGRLEIPAEAKSLRIELENGRVEVHPGVVGALAFRGAIRRAADNEEQLQQFEARGVDLRLELDPARPGVAILRGPTRPAEVRGGMLAVELHVDIPVDLELRVEIAGSGVLVAEDRQAKTQLRTGRGDVRLMRCAGGGELTTGAGNVIAYDHRGDIDVSVGTGDMQVFVREPASRIRLVTGMGNVQCLVPPDTHFRVDARVETGKIATGFGFPIERPSAYSAGMTGVRGDGRTEVVLRSGKGHLSLSHKQFD